MSKKKNDNIKDGLAYNATTGEYQAVDRVNRRVLENIRVPGAEPLSERRSQPEVPDDQEGRSTVQLSRGDATDPHDQEGRGTVQLSRTDAADPRDQEERGMVQLPRPGQAGAATRDTEEIDQGADQDRVTTEELEAIEQDVRGTVQLGDGDDCNRDTIQVRVGRASAQSQDRVPTVQLASVSEDSPRGAGHDSVNLQRITQQLGKAAQPAGPLAILDPETALKSVALAHLDFFADDFASSGEDFIKIRYHVGRRGEAWEFYSQTYPIKQDSWSIVQDLLTEHVRTEFAELGKSVVESVRVGLVLFHQPGIFTHEPTMRDVLSAPLDFATSLQLTVGELMDFVGYGQVPKEFRISFDASYLWLGPETTEPFKYSRHWHFFEELLIAFSELIQRPLSGEDLPIRIIHEHASDDLAKIVTSVGMTDRRTYEGQERVYRPRIEVTFAADRTEVSMIDRTGVIRGFASFFEPGDFQRTTEKDRIILTRLY
ncbi:MAG: hypothetical protein ABI333_21595 [bacterium]